MQLKGPTSAGLPYSPTVADEYRDRFQHAGIITPMGRHRLGLTHYTAPNWLREHVLGDQYRLADGSDPHRSTIYRTQTDT